MSGRKATMNGSRMSRCRAGLATAAGPVRTRGIVVHTGSCGQRGRPGAGGDWDA